MMRVMFVYGYILCLGDDVISNVFYRHTSGDHC